MIKSKHWKNLNKEGTYNCHITTRMPECFKTLNTQDSLTPNELYAHKEVERALLHYKLCFALIPPFHRLQREET